MSIVDFLSGFVPLVVIGSFALIAMRLLRRARDEDATDTATLMRQSVMYGLLYLTMVLTASGATWAYGELVDSSRRLENSGLAQALALIALGLPVFTILLTIADRRLAKDPQERRGIVWALYLNAALLTTLIVTMVGVFRVLRDMLDTRSSNHVDGSDVIMALTWGTFWLVHWLVLLRRHGTRGDSHLAIGSIVGIVTLGIGNVGLFYALFDRVYTELTDDSLLERAGPTTSEWAALFAVGGIAWLWFWLGHFEDGVRTESWYVTVVPVGSLIGFSSLVVAAAASVHSVLVWWVGDPSATTAVRHFDQLPFLLAVLLTGACSLGYHRWLLGTGGDRNDPIRVYEHLLMGAALVASSLGAIVTIGGLTRASSVDTNDVLAGLTLLAAGGPLWVAFHRSSEQRAADMIEEETSHIRATYMYAVVGLAGLTMLSGGISALEGVLEDVLDSRFGLHSLQDHRIAISTLAVATLVLWRHIGSLQLIRDTQVAPPPPASPHWPRRVIVLGGDIPGLQGSEHPDATVEYWHRTDRADVAVIDVARLSDQLEHQYHDDVLVVVDDDGPVLIPFTR